MPARSATFALVLALALPVTAAAQGRETERVTRTVSLQPGGTLTLKNFSGHVEITGHDRNEVVIDAVRRAPRERLERIALDIQSSGSTVTIDANHKIRGGRWFQRDNDNVVETSFEIKVPRRTALDVNVFSSDVRLRDIAAPVRAHSFSGNIVVELASTEHEPELSIDTFSGDIDVRVPADARAGISFSSFSGDLDSDLPLTLRRNRKRQIEADLNGGSARRVRFKTFSGDVRIRR